MSNNASAQLFGQLNEFMEEVAAEKQAAATGTTSHPSESVDDNTQTASEGARSAENTSDVKSTEPGGIQGVSPDNLPEASPGADDQDKRQINIGTQQSATGEDPSVEDDYKGDKDDPGTSHPADTSDGEKYGSALEEKCANASFEEAKTAALNLGNDILADFANGFGFSDTQIQKVADTSKKAEAVPARRQAVVTDGSAVEEKQAAVPEEIQEAADAGYLLASVLGMEKLSEEERAQATIEQTIKDAQFDADLVGGYLTTLATEAQKAAEHDLEDVVGGAVEGEDHDEPGDEDSGAAEGGGGELMEEAALEEPSLEGDGEELPPEGGLPPELLGGGPEGLPPELLGGGPEMGGGPEGLPPELLGGGPEMGGGLGGPEMGGGMGGPEMGGGMPDEAAVAEALGGLGPAPEEAGAGIGEEESLAQLAMALEELGVSPEELAAAAMEGGPGAQGQGPKLASAVKAYKRSGNFEHKATANGRERKIRDLMKAHVLELLG